MKKNLAFIFAFFAVCLSFPLKSFAAPVCACCAEQGHYSISTRTLNQYAFDELKKLKFDSPELYTDAGYPDTIRGINPLGDNFTIDAFLSSNLWRFIFKDDKSKSGTLNLAKPVSMVEYMVDQTPATEGEPSRMVRLYKEWRFKYRVNSGNGFFQSGIAPRTEYFLVLQGNGNICTSAEDFKYWRLEVTGAKAQYAFFGKVGSK